MPVCLFSNKRKEGETGPGIQMGKEERWEGSGQCWGRGNHSQNTLYQKNLFSIKK